MTGSAPKLLDSHCRFYVDRLYSTIAPANIAICILGVGTGGWLPVSLVVKTKLSVTMLSLPVNVATNGALTIDVSTILHR